MAVKAIAIVQDVVPKDETRMCAVVKFVINDGTFSQDIVYVEGTKEQIGNLTPTQFLQQVRLAVQNKMISDYGFTFTGNDTIRVIGSMD
jgi:hypothetical protein